jgi:tRNA (mo5U34)-methyltransferase
MAVQSREQALKRIHSFDYWNYPFDLGEGITITPSGGAERARQKLQLRDFIWPEVLRLCGGSLEGMRVLDVACNAGFWSLEAHKAGAAYVLGIEARPDYVEQATLVRDALGIAPAQLEYRQMDLYNLSRREVGEFDLVLMLRILHHLSHPLWALQRIREICRTYLVLDVKLMRQDQPVLYLAVQDEEGLLGGVGCGLRLRPTRSALELMLRESGFTDIQAVPPRSPLEAEYAKGKRALFTARVLAGPRGPGDASVPIDERDRREGGDG